MLCNSDAPGYLIGQEGITLSHDVIMMVVIVSYIHKKKKKVSYTKSCTQIKTRNEVHRRKRGKNGWIGKKMASRTVHVIVKSKFQEVLTLFCIRVCV